LDGCQRLQNAALFEELYELWTTDGLISKKIATAQFEVRGPFIFTAIVDTFPEKKQCMISAMWSRSGSFKVRLVVGTHSSMMMSVT